MAASEMAATETTNVNRVHKLSSGRLSLIENKVFILCLKIPPPPPHIVPGSSFVGQGCIHQAPPLQRQCAQPQQSRRCACTRSGPFEVGGGLKRTGQKFKKRENKIKHRQQ
jgi:hypothetical protein